MSASSDRRRSSTSSTGKQRRASGSDPPTNGAEADPLTEGDDALNPDFRYQLGLLRDDDEGLTEAFRASIGLIGPEGINQVSEVLFTPDLEKEETISRFKYTQYVKNNFQNGISGSYAGAEPLKEPILPKKHDVDHMASLAVWIAILRYMGDIPAPKGVPITREKTPVMTKIYRTLQRYTRRRSSRSNSDASKPVPKEQKEYLPFKMRKRSSWKKIMSLVPDGLSRAGSQKEAPAQPDIIDYQGSGAALVERVPLHEMDLIHFIVGHGILRKDLRDEIYCQLCKQLNKNPNGESQTRGWMLMSLCSGCFMPSEELLKYLLNFLTYAPPAFKDYAAYSKKVMQRTSVNGMRYHPPNWLEYQASKLRKYVMLPVTLPDGSVQTLEADAATTASEMCNSLANRVGLKDQFGFSVYICIFNKVSSLGSGLDHLMDAISECEQVLRSKGGKEEEAPWRLYFRKELFTPWHDPSYDVEATRLIYQQLSRGIKSEEYRFRSEEELAKAVARRFFIEHGSAMVPGKLQQSLQEYLPDSAFKGGRARESWMQMIISAFEQLGYNEGNTTALKAKEDLVISAPKLWPLQFSGLFEAFRICGPQFPKNDVVIAVSSSGFYVCDEPYRIVALLEYYEIVEIFCSRKGKVRGQSFSLITVKGDAYTFISPNSETITNLVMTFLDGLRRRSPFGVGLQDFRLEGAEPFNFRQGDVLCLKEDQEGPKQDEWCVGINERTGKKGRFPLDAVYILPTIERPPDEFLSLFSAMRSEETMTLPRKRGAVILSKETIGRHGAHGKETAA